MQASNASKQCKIVYGKQATKTLYKHKQCKQAMQASKQCKNKNSVWKIEIPRFLTGKFLTEEF